MPDVVGVTPQPETLSAPNNVYRKPVNPLEQLKQKAVPSVQQDIQEALTPPPRLAFRYQADDPQEVTADPVEPDNQEQVAGPAPEIKGSPYARIRVLEREREIERKRARDLEDQVALLAKVVDKSGLLEEEEDEVVDLDPLTRLQRGQESILEEFENVKKAAVEQREERAKMTVIGQANQDIINFAAKADQVRPGLYQDATVHLVNVKMAELLEDDVSLTTEEAAAQVTEWIAGVKEKAAKSGKNAGEEFLRRSVLHGFQMPQVPQSGKNPTQNGNKPKDAAQEIAEERKRKQSLGSISTVQGAPVNDPMRNTAGMSEKDRVRTIMNSYKERGSFRRGGTLEETLKHKIRQ